MNKILFGVLLLMIVAVECFAYIPGDYLLKKNGIEIMWGQSKNVNSLPEKTIQSHQDEKCGCNPSYNYFCPTNMDGNETCYLMRAGCASIAMGQIMAMWQYPSESKYNKYDWGKIPAQLQDGDSYDCPRLIRDIGDAVNMHYQTFAGFHEIVLPVIDFQKEIMTGSWCTISNIKEGFETFGYNAIIEDSDDWKNYGNSWNDLIRSEIECGRPVIMYGQHNKIEIKEKHYFVIDGYSATCPDNFHVNWGWKGNHNGFSDLNACGYSNGQKVIVGIAPVQDCKLDFSISCTQINKNVNACPDSKDSKLRFYVSNADSYQCTIYDRNKKVYWRSAGVVRSSSVDVWDGSSASKLLEDTYYYEVVFKNSKGCCKTANGSFVYSSLPLFNSIQYELKKEMMWISPNCESSWLTFDVENVEMWKFDLYDRNKKHLDTYKGTVKDGIAMVWSGESSRKLISKNDYWFTVEFFDKCESSQLYEGHRTVLDWECFATDETLIYSDAEEKIFFMQDVGNTILSFCSIDQSVHIKIYDVKGMLFFDLDTDDFSYKLDISSLPKGLYFVDMIGNGWSKQSKFMHK